MIKQSSITLKGTYYFSDKTLIKLKRIAVGAKVSLQHESENEFDEFAVPVFLSSTNEQIGYLPRTHSRKFANLVNLNKIESAVIEKIEKGEKPAYRIVVKITYQSEEIISLDERLFELTLKQLTSSSGVYAIKNIINNKAYIGSSENIKKRADQHLSSLKNNTHSNLVLQQDYNSLGSSKFRFELVKQNVPSYDLIYEESKQLNDLRKNGIPVYNLTDDGVGSYTKRSTPRQIVRPNSITSNTDIIKFQNELNRTRQETSNKVELSFGKTFAIVFVVLLIILIITMQKYSLSIVFTLTIIGTFFVTVIFLAIKDFIDKP